MKSLPYIIGAIIIIIGIGYLLSTQDTDTATVATSPSTETALTPTESTDQAQSVTPAEDSVAPTEEAASQPGTYRPYDAELIANSDAEHILLFFHATWCPSCRALDADITENAATIPSNVEIYKLDYDTETDLKRQYGVTTQHSIIEIDATGKAVGRINHPLTFEQLLGTI